MESHFRLHLRLWSKMKNAFLSASSIHHKKIGLKIGRIGLKMQNLGLGLEH